LSLKNKICVITGANSGIGKETSRGLAALGTKLVMVTRDKEKGEATRDELLKQTGNQNIVLMQCDLSSIHQVKHLSEELTSLYNHIDVLINNAGALFSKRTVTNENLECSFTVNYLAPLYLTHLVLPSLMVGSSCRIINLTSGLHKQGTVRFDDLQNQIQYNSMKAYSNAKLMVILGTYYLARLLKDSGVCVNAVQPGFAATNLGKNSGSLVQEVMFGAVRFMQTTASKAAETSIYLASSPDVEGVTGMCFAKKKPVKTSLESYDEDKQRKLYEISLEILKIEPIQVKRS
jgi:NAD(P)-dependent dehydrogenase (short-subunit alcohol dehydrogenase family)